MKIRLKKDTVFTQSKGCYCIHIGTWAFMFGNKQGWKIELCTPLYLFRFSRGSKKKEIKPCPFCNSGNVKLYRNFDYVFCNNCGAKGTYFDGHPEDAINAWNNLNSV